MRYFVRLAALMAVSAPLVGSRAAAQQPLPATTVQLPTIRQFTVRTTVSVPDGGTMPLGGNYRGTDGRITRGYGPFDSRGSGSERATNGVGVSARIIDHAEIDRAILAAAPGRAKLAEPVELKAESLSRSVRHATSAPTSVASIRNANAAADELQTRETADLFAKAQAAEAARNIGAAKVYYQMVARRDRGQLKLEAESRLAHLSKPAERSP